VTPGTADATYKATTSISYEAVATPVGGGTAVSSNRGGINVTNLRINGLVNDQPYDVVAYAYSSALNRGPASASVTGTPKYFASFWEAYQDAGGQEQGGCGGGAGALSLLALLPLALRRRWP
jgi:Synergist-CTERM protein sorting domain-containing protein